MADRQPDQDYLLEKLCKEIANRNAVVIVGAGISVGATKGVSTASWRGLLRDGVARCEQVVPGLPREWSRRVRDEIESQDKDDLLSAAEKVTQKLKLRGGEYGRWLREAVGSLRAAELGAIAALLDLDVPLATTNYDGLIEEVSRWESVTWRQGAQAEYVLRGQDQCVLHLHGYWRDPDSVVLGIWSYEEVLGDEYIQALLRAMLSTRTLLFVGFGAGLADPNFGTLLDWYRHVFAARTEFRHYRLALRSEVDQVQAEHQGDRIYVLHYGEQHADLPGFLRSLAPGAPNPPPPPGANARPDASTCPGVDAHTQPGKRSRSDTYTDAGIRTNVGARDPHRGWRRKRRLRDDLRGHPGGAAAVAYSRPPRDL